MDVSTDEVLVGQVEPRQAHGPRDHQAGTAEEILVVRIARGAVSQHQGGLTAPAGPAAPLGIVCRRRRHVPHVDHVELTDVDAELHRGRAIQDGELAGAEILLALLPLLVWDLGSVLAGLESPAIARDGAIEFDEEWVGAAALLRQIRNPDRVVKRLGSIAGLPGHAGRREPVTRYAIVCDRSGGLDDELGFSQDPEKVDADLVPLPHVEFVPAPLELRENSRSAQELAEATASGQKGKVAAFLWLAGPGEDRGGQLRSLLLVDGPGRPQPLRTLLQKPLVELLGQVFHVDRQLAPEVVEQYGSDGLPGVGDSRARARDGNPASIRRPGRARRAIHT